MDTATAETRGMSSIADNDLLYDAIRGVGIVGGYIQNIIADTVYYAGKYIAYVRDVCLSGQGAGCCARPDESKISMVRMVRSDAAIDEDDKREFYLHLGRDLVTATKSGLNSENLTILDLSRYEL
jgi:hypothetical protein